MKSTSIAPMSAFTGTHIFGEVGVEEAAEAGIDLARLAQGGADAPDHAAADLARGGARAHHPAAIGDADDARHADAAGLRLDAHLDEVRDVAERDVTAG